MAKSHLVASSVLYGLAFFLAVYPFSSNRTTDVIFRSFNGGHPAGLLLAYTGSFLLVAAQFYTVVKRVGIPSYMRKLGGPKLWLTLHIALSFAGLLAVLVHAGFPFRFRYDLFYNKGFAGLATWLLIISTLSGVFGRYLYGKLPVMRRPFRYWKQVHIVITALLFVFAISHMMTVTLLGGD